MMLRCILILCLVVAVPVAAQTQAPPAAAPANPHGNDKLDCAACHAEAVGPGDTICIPPGTPHCIENTGIEALHLLCCCAPAYAHDDTELL